MSLLASTTTSNDDRHAAHCYKRKSYMCPWRKRVLKAEGDLIAKFKYREDGAGPS